MIPLIRERRECAIPQQERQDTTGGDFYLQDEQ